ncbi:uncharacterized protein LOC133194848 isoform X2 [Saccostrea echinata]|uniref:uncharacterized protein LOC133190777 n=1 Tax=Saccostrea echinata TaxID=191078 RepID=UPI002A8332A6|nr:uncharacterized protein LOC133190777 [Saccostrea echinata]XP_061186744.1 uncharacterized protein LOC133194848 isoform X2 [Saccostrea echinata]
MAGCYPCVQCKKRCRNNTIQCCNCNRWVHVHCVPMSSSQLKMWSQPLLSFLCRDCCFTDNEYDFSKALERISSALHSDPKDLKMTVSSESLLLETYGVKIPKQTNPSDQTVDEVSRDILKQFHPAILSAVFPAKTVGDGNCMYRAVSRAMTGSESHHVHFRLLTAIEILQNKSSLIRKIVYAQKVYFHNICINDN